MAQFKIKEGSFEEMRKKMLKWLIPFGVIALAIVVINGKMSNTRDDSDKYVSAITVCVVAAFVTFSFYNVLRKQKKIFDSYVLTIDEFMITREQFNTPEISMSFNELEDISKTKNGGFIIKGKYKGELIFVPKQIERVDELEKMLNNIMPISTSDEALKKLKYQNLFNLLGIPFMFGVIFFDNKIAVTVCGVLAIAFNIWRFIKIQQNKNIDKGTKQRAYLSFIWLAMILFMMYVKLLLVASS